MTTPGGQLERPSATAKSPDERLRDEELQRDRTLLDGLRQRDEAAAAELVHRYGGRLMAVARRLLRRDADAQDAVQDAFLAAFRALPAFRGECRLSTWLHRIVVNVALMRLRARKRHAETPIEDLLPVFASDGHHAATFTPWLDVERQLAGEETRALVRAAVDRLPESYRTVLVLRDIEELDTTEVAALLRISPNAVKIRLHRARQALVTLLSPTFGSPTTDPTTAPRTAAAGSSARVGRPPRARRGANGPAGAVAPDARAHPAAVQTEAAA